MKRTHRLQDRDIKTVLRRGRRIITSFFRVSILNNTLSHARFAFVISRAVEKRSVRRNLLRRRAREWIRKGCIMDSPLDVVVIFTRVAAQAPRAEFYAEIQKLCKKICG